MTPTRRRFLTSTASLGTATLATPLAGQFLFESQKGPPTVRDKLWLWAHYEGSHNHESGIPPRVSRITPVEAAVYLSVPNVIMVSYAGKPTPPYDQYAIPFAGLREVVWSVVGASGQTSDNDRDVVLQLASQTPNITGVIMDDFFSGDHRNTRGAISVRALAALKAQLAAAPRQLRLWVTLYTDQLDSPIGDYLKHIDVITLWNQEPVGINQFLQDLTKAETLFPHVRKVLGCYMWNYAEGKPMPVSFMEKQCELGLDWLRSGRIDGMIFLASCICDLRLEAVEWTRAWIARVGSNPLRA